MMERVQYEQELQGVKERWKAMNVAEKVWREKQEEFDATSRGVRAAPKRANVFNALKEKVAEYLDEMKGETMESVVLKRFAMFAKFPRRSKTVLVCVSEQQKKICIGEFGIGVRRHMQARGVTSTYDAREVLSVAELPKAMRKLGLVKEAEVVAGVRQLLQEVREMGVEEGLKVEVPLLPEDCFEIVDGRDMHSIVKLGVEHTPYSSCGSTLCGINAEGVSLGLNYVEREDVAALYIGEVEKQRYYLQKFKESLDVFMQQRQVVLKRLDELTGKYVLANAL